MRSNWQTLVTLAMGLAAALYLARRWWPGLRSLFAAPTATPPATACSTHQMPSPGASCGGGCGNCGHNVTIPTKDHRIQVVRTKRR